MRVSTLLVSGLLLFSALSPATSFAEEDRVRNGKKDGELGLIEVFQKPAVDSETGRDNTRGRYVITVANAGSCPDPVFQKQKLSPMTTKIVCGKDKDGKDIEVGTYYGVTLQEIVREPTRDSVKGYFQAPPDGDNRNVYSTTPFFQRPPSAPVATATP